MLQRIIRGKEAVKTEDILGMEINQILLIPLISVATVRKIIYITQNV